MDHVIARYDDYIMKGAKTTAVRMPQPSGSDAILVRGREFAPRSFYFRPKDFEKHGFTDRCAGCEAIIRGLRIQPHAEHCRRKMEKLLEDNIRVKNAKVRLGDTGQKVRE